MARPGTRDLSAVSWTEVRRHPLPLEAVRLQRPGVARVARLLVDRFWAAVGNGVQPRAEVCVVPRRRFAGAEGRTALGKVDDTIRRLPRFAPVKLFEAWMDHHVGSTGADGGRNGNPNH